MQGFPGTSGKVSCLKAESWVEFSLVSTEKNGSRSEQEYEQVPAGPMQELETQLSHKSDWPGSLTQTSRQRKDCGNKESLGGKKKTAIDS